MSSRRGIGAVAGATELWTGTSSSSSSRAGSALLIFQQPALNSKAAAGTLSPYYGLASGEWLPKSRFYPRQAPAYSQQHRALSHNGHSFLKIISTAPLNTSRVPLFGPSAGVLLRRLHVGTGGGGSTQRRFVASDGGHGTSGDSPAASSATPAIDAAKAGPKLVSTRELWAVFIASALPFVGFGFLDNFLMILAGDMIDATLCVAFGFSTMAAAALGNTLSDVAGVFSGGVVEDLAQKAGIEMPPLESDQLRTFKVKLYQYIGQAFGIIFGCVIGMCPLLWYSSNTSKSCVNAVHRPVRAVWKMTNQIIELHSTWFW